MKTKKTSHSQLSAKGLHKRYGKRWVVRDVDLKVNKGEIVGEEKPVGYVAYHQGDGVVFLGLSLIHISEPT